MQYRSRIHRRFSGNPILTLIVVILFFAFLFFIGIQMVIKLSLFLGSARSISGQNTSESNSILLPPSLDALPEATFSATIAVSGAAQPGQKVEVYNNDSLVSDTTADNDSHFSITSVSLTKGKNTIKAKVKQDKQESKFSENHIVIFDNEAPKFDLSQPNDGTVTRDSSIKIAGKTEPGASVMINNFIAIVDGNGNFSYNFPLNEGDNSIKIIVRDPAGNATEREIKVRYEK